MKFTAIDFETANYKRSSVCSLGLAVFENGELIEQQYYLIKPVPNYYEATNTRIHGITKAKTDTVPNFEVLWPQISKYFNDSVLVAHNAGFDLSALRAVL